MPEMHPTYVVTPIVTAGRQQFLLTDSRTQRLVRSYRSLSVAVSDAEFLNGARPDRSRSAVRSRRS
jgi:hypothetical protein